MIKINLDKARNIAHDKRRAARAEEFAPLDIKATIPAEATAAEQARQAIREKYAALQAQMDAAQTPEELKTLLP
jgi:Spy/CpxP family protein refolding chaperone